jgi:outer membrane biosynthesis protein TonB
MSSGRHADELAAQAAEAVRRVVADAEDRAAEILGEAETKAASIREQAEGDAARIRERAEADARAQIEAAKRALDELGGTLVAAATEAIPKSETPEPDPDAEPEPEPEPGPDPDPEPEPTPEPETPAESPGAPETPVSPPAANGNDAAERLVAMKLAVEGMDPAAIEAELIERFGPGDRSSLLRDVISRATR